MARMNDEVEAMYREIQTEGVALLGRMKSGVTKPSDTDWYILHTLLFLATRMVEVERVLSVLPGWRDKPPLP